MYRLVRQMGFDLVVLLQPDATPKQSQSRLQN